MARFCTISCPACRQAVEVRISGTVICSHCTRPFDIGVYSPPPESFDGPGATKLHGVTISGNWLKIRDRSYPMTDIVGASLTQPGNVWWSGSLLVTLILAIAAGFERHWPLAGGLLLVSGLIYFQMRKRPRPYVVSWLTRAGREERQTLPDREAAGTLLGALRSFSN